MANEAVLIFETQPPIPFTVSNSTGIEKGTPLALSDPMTAAAISTLGQPCAGIAASEKIASDGNTKLGVYRGGIFKIKISGNVTAGDPLTTSNQVVANTFEKAITNEEDVWFTAMETGTDGQTILAELRPTTMSLA